MISTDIFGNLPYRVSKQILVTAIRHHAKASEAYIDVEFDLPDGEKWIGSIPVNYRNTAANAGSAEEAIALLEAAYAAWNPINVALWKKEAKAEWGEGRADITKPFFDKMLAKLGDWTCQHHELPRNANWARRTQDIKARGFTLATDTSRFCNKCGGRKTHLMLLPIPIGQGSRYETMSRPLIKKIVRVLGSRDAFEGKVVPPAGLLPDHKFPEVRWNSDTGVDNPESMSEQEIRSKFQLLNNQRNQQKREVCRGCFQTGVRGYPFGVKFYADGDEHWPDDVPQPVLAPRRDAKVAAGMTLIFGVGKSVGDLRVDGVQLAAKSKADNFSKSRGYGVADLPHGSFHSSCKQVRVGKTL